VSESIRGTAAVKLVAEARERRGTSAVEAVTRQRLAKTQYVL
jgi:hypothetical protein